MTTVIDTDALIGLIDRDDAHYAVTHQLAQRLVALHATSYILPTTLSEFAALVTRRIGRAQAQRVVTQLIQSEYFVLPMTDEVTQAAITLYQAQTSKEETLFDCYVMAAAKTIQADCIFSFDRGYRKNAFQLIEDVVRV